MNSHSLVEDVAEKVGFVSQSVALVGGLQHYRDLPFDFINDLRPSLGPLAGIEAALASDRGELSLIVACDMPNLQVKWLQDLITTAIKFDGDCVVCRDSGGAIHPLCGAWRRNSLPGVRNALDRGRFRVLDLIQELKSVYLPVDEFIHNVNTPNEWEAWCSWSNM
jgi:molybdopterin-guanine dinucleotide biosynthesis protein A